MLIAERRFLVLLIYTLYYVLSVSFGLLLGLEYQWAPLSKLVT